MFLYKYYLNDHKLIWDKRIFFQTEYTRTEINFKDIKEIRFMPTIFPLNQSCMTVYSNKKKIGIAISSDDNREVVSDSKGIAIYEALVCTVLEKLRSNKDVKYSKGNLVTLITIFICWLINLPVSFFSWQLVYNYFSKSDFISIGAFAATTLGSTVFVILAPSYILNSIPKIINPEHILKYSPKVIFNKTLRKFIYKETGEKIN